MLHVRNQACILQGHRYAVRCDLKPAGARFRSTIIHASGTICIAGQSASCQASVALSCACCSILATSARKLLLVGHMPIGLHPSESGGGAHQTKQHDERAQQVARRRWWLNASHVKSHSAVPKRFCSEVTEGRCLVSSCQSNFEVAKAFDRNSAGPLRTATQLTN